MKKTLLILVATFLATIGRADTFNVFNVTTPGTLEQVIDEAMQNAEDLDIYQLKVTGRINSADLRYIREASGYLTNMTSLDLSEVELVPSTNPTEDYYYKASKLVDGAFGGYTLYYCYSDTTAIENHTYMGAGSAIGGYMILYANDLREAFSSLGKVREVKLPSFKSTELGEDIFLGCDSLRSVQLPNNITKIGDGAFDGCKKLDMTLPSSVTEVGERAFYLCSSLTQIDLSNIKIFGECAFAECASMTDVLDLSNAEKIGSLAFENCAFTSLKLPSNITEIGYSVFSCNKFVELNLSEYKSLKHIGNSAFYGNESLKSLSLPVGLEEIGSSAFYECSQLKSLVLPEGLKTVNEAAFKKCYNITSIEFPNSIESIGKGAFEETAWLKNLSGDENGFIYAGKIIIGYTKIHLEYPSELVIPNGTIGIAEGAFLGGGGVNVTKLTLPNSLQYIGKECFRNFSKLTELTIPDSVTTIADYAFNSCCNIAKLTLSKRLKTLGVGAFRGCTSLTEVTIPESLEDIGYETSDGGPFDDCTGLVRVIWNAVNCHYDNAYDRSPFYGLTSIKQFRFGDKVETIPNCLLSGLSSVTSVTLPASLKKIGECAFYQSGLTSISIPAQIDTIRPYTFFNTPLKTIEWQEPSTLKVIGDDAFEFTKIKTLTLPASVDSIGERAFRECDSLRQITIPENIRAIGDGAFLASLRTIYYNAINANTGEDFLGYYLKGKKIVIGSKVERIAWNYHNDTNYITKTINADVEFEEPSSLKYLDQTFMVTEWRQNLPKSTTYVGSVAVAYNSSSTSGKSNIYLKKGTTCIAGGFCLNSQAVNTVNIPNTVTSIGNFAFYNSSLSSLTIPESVTEIGNYAFGHTKLTSLEIPNTVTQIGASAFSGSELTQIQLPSDITAIGRYLLCGTKITDITIPDSVRTIDGYAFYGCSSLTSMVMPEALNQIHDYALSGCSKLKDIYCPATVPPAVVTSIGSSAKESSEFNSFTASSATLHVLPECVDTYKSANVWKDFNVVGDYATAINTVSATSSDVIIRVTDNGISVVNTTAPVSVYNISGRCIYHGQGEFIRLNAGVYIVKTDKGNQKVVVK